jgi:hypothetical protein
MKRFMKLIAANVLVTFFAMVTLPASAGMVSSSEMVKSQQQMMDKQSILNLVDREDAQQQLVDLGVDPMEVKDRVANMSDAEVAQINTQLSMMQAGGNNNTIIMVLLIVIIVILLL